MTPIDHRHSTMAQLKAYAIAEMLRIAASPVARKLVVPSPGVVTGITSNSEVRLGAGTFLFPQPLDCKNVLVSGVGPQTIIKTVPGKAAFGFTDNSEKITIRNLSLDGGGSGAQVRGKEIVLSTIRLMSLGQVFNLANVVGMIISGLNCTDPAKIIKQVIIASNARQVFMGSLYLTGCKEESVIRTIKDKPTDIGLVDSALFDTELHQDVPNNSKGSISLRAGDSITLNGVTSTDANIGIRTGGADGGQRTTITRVFGKGIKINGSKGGKLEISDGASDIAFEDFNFTSPTGELISVKQNALPAITKLSFKRGTGHSKGGHSFINCYLPVRALLDCRVDDSKLHVPNPAKVPFAKNEKGPIVVGTNNNVLAGV